MSQIQEWVYDRPDFLARLQAIPQPKSGLRQRLRQGVKLDLMYAGDKNQAWMVYYALLDTEGNLLPPMSDCQTEVDAYFRVLDLQLRATVHRQRLKPGIQFYIVIGSHKVAEGTVVELLHLLKDETIA